MQADGKKEGQTKMLIQAVNMRWNSCFDMIERFCLLSAPIAKILASKSYLRNVPDMVLASEIKILKDLITLLGGFKQATGEISGEKYVTASLAIPLSNLLLQNIELFEPNTIEGKVIQTELIKGINERLIPLENNSFFAKATILDPRFKKLYFKSALAVANTITEISKEIYLANKEKGKNSPARDSPPLKMASNSLWERHNKIILETSTSNNITTAGSVPTELRQYLNEPNIPKTASPLKYWKERFCFSPVLSEISKKYLIPSASSVSSERIASTINIVVQDNRSRLTADHIKERVFLQTICEKYWLQ